VQDAVAAGPGPGGYRVPPALWWVPGNRGAYCSLSRRREAPALDMCLGGRGLLGYCPWFPEVLCPMAVVALSGGFLCCLLGGSVVVPAVGCSGTVLHGGCWWPGFWGPLCLLLIPGRRWPPTYMNENLYHIFCMFIHAHTHAHTHLFTQSHAYHTVAVSSTTIMFYALAVVVFHCLLQFLSISFSFPFLFLCSPSFPSLPNRLSSSG